jgi:hypothetical protein
MKNKLYSIGNLNIDALMAELEQFFKMQGHQVQLLPVGGAHVLQAQKESTFSAITGQSSALTIKVHPEGDSTRVEIGSSKWIDKAAVGMIGYVIMPVLAIIPMIGMYNQYKLGEDAWRIIDAFVARSLRQAKGSTPESGAGAHNCANCGGWLAANAAFCSSCGAQAQTPPTCSKCGQINLKDARFCSRCGSRF